jgi:hypothetical protein
VKLQGFFSRTEDVRGGRCKRLNLSGSDTKYLAWKKAALSNLHSHEDYLQDIMCVPVARHHWMILQLESVESAGGKRISSPVDKKTIQSIAHVFDPQDCIKRGNAKKQEMKYFNVPNVLKRDLEAEIQGHLRVSRKAER